MQSFMKMVVAFILPVCLVGVAAFSVVRSRQGKRLRAWLNRPHRTALDILQTMAAVGLMIVATLYLGSALYLAVFMLVLS